MSNKTYNPDDDGIQFINVYTKATTRLGRLLTNLADIPVTHPTYGTFRTCEGLYYYLRTGCTNEELRALTGFEVKALGRTLPMVWNDAFQEEFKLGLRAKIIDHNELFLLFVSSTLPFVHYYVYASKDKTKVPKIHVPKDQLWMMEYLETLRMELQMKLSTSHKPMYLP